MRGRRLSDARDTFDRPARTEPGSSVTPTASFATTFAENSEPAA